MVDLLCSSPNAKNIYCANAEATNRLCCITFWMHILFKDKVGGKTKFGRSAQNTQCQETARGGKKKKIQELWSKRAREMVAKESVFVGSGWSS